MIVPDLINGAFEASGAFFIYQSIRRLHRDKLVRGVSWWTTAFFMSWGFWNLYYYPYLGQWLSLAGGCAIAAANAVYLGMLVYYMRKERS